MASLPSRTPLPLARHSAASAYSFWRRRSSAASSSRRFPAMSVRCSERAHRALGMFHVVDQACAKSAFSVRSASWTAASRASASGRASSASTVRHSRSAAGRRMASHEEARPREPVRRPGRVVIAALSRAPGEQQVQPCRPAYLLQHAGEGTSRVLRASLRVLQTRLHPSHLRIRFQHRDQPGEPRRVPERGAGVQEEHPRGVEPFERHAVPSPEAERIEAPGARAS